MTSDIQTSRVLDIDEWNGIQMEMVPFEEETQEESHLKTRPSNTQGNVTGSTQRANATFQYAICLDVCVHGRGKQKDKDHLSLLIWHFCLQSRHKVHQYKSASVDISFWNEANPKGPHPEVFNWCPFKTPVRSDLSHETSKTKTSFKAELGVSYVADASGSAMRERERTLEKRFFRNSSSVPSAANDGSGNISGVKWSFTENRSQGGGICPDFHLALLVKPRLNDDGEPMPFNGKIDLRLSASAQYDVEDRVIRLFCAKPGHVVRFDPSREMKFHDTGERVKEDVTNNRDQLDVYAEGGHDFAELLEKIGTPP